MLLALVPLIAAADPSAYRSFPDPYLQQGGAIWIKNCEGCHGYGVADAPIPMEPAQWAPRLKQDIAILHTHAINGFFCPDNAMMPARGGNPGLSDEQVKAAVDYMVALANFYIEQKR